MSQSHEPSYYEIALTNRQVFVIFVVLLVCVVAAFFSGVWMGRRDSLAPAAEVVEETSPAGTTDLEEATPVGELHFFADQEGEESPSLVQMAEKPKPDSTLLEDLGGEPATDPRPQGDPAETAPSMTDTAPETGGPAREAAATPAAGGYVIQVFSSADEVQARKLLQQLGDAGYPAFLSPVEVGTQTMMRVRIGPFPELAEAETVAERIRRAFKLDTWVTR